MRFQASIHLQGDPPVKVPARYRRNLLSLIKAALQSGNGQGEFFTRYYGERADNRQKPFTFSAQLPVQNLEKGKQSTHLVLAQEQFRLFFSACDPVFLIQVYNGLVNLKKGFPLFSGFEASVRGFSLQKEQAINASEMVFKSFSPFLVRAMGEDKRGKGYLRFDEDGFAEQLFYTVQNLCQNFIRPGYVLERSGFEFMPVKCKAAPVPLYGNEMGNSGIFRLKAPAEVLQLIYDAGLGAKRSQGFGMLEVLG